MDRYGANAALWSWDTGSLTLFEMKWSHSLEQEAWRTTILDPSAQVHKQEIIAARSKL